MRLQSRRKAVVDRAEPVEVDAVGADRAVGDRLGDGVGLLVDLLEHEGLVAALLGHLLAPVDLVDRALDGLAGGVEELDAVAAHDHDLVVLDQLHAAGVGEEGGDGGGDELLVVAAADDQRALLAGAHQQVGLVGGDRDERVVAAQPVVGAQDGVDELVALVEVAGDQVRDDLGVGLGGEDGAAGDQLLLELHVVLDDPVDHDVDAVVGVVVRVRVGLGDAAVGGPAGVADPGRRGRRRDGHAAGLVLGDLLVDGGAQGAQVADGAHGVEVPVAEHRDARRVIAAVLELLEPREEDILDRARSHIADDSAHERRDSRAGLGLLPHHSSSARPPRRGARRPRRPRPRSAPRP